MSKMCLRRERVHSTQLAGREQLHRPRGGFNTQGIPGWHRTALGDLVAVWGPTLGTAPSGTSLGDDEEKEKCRGGTIYGLIVFSRLDGLCPCVE